MIGRVVSTKSKGTVVVLVERIATHPLYKKTFLRTKKFLVDDAVGVKDGDMVNIEKCRPISKRKHWKVTKVVGQSLAEITAAHLKEKAAEVIAEVMPEEKEAKQETVDIEQPEEKKEKKVKVEKKGKNGSA